MVSFILQKEHDYEQISDAAEAKKKASRPAHVIFFEGFSAMEYPGISSAVEPIYW